MSSSLKFIPGSNKRGSIYGLYDISEQIGVSPWYWFADVPAQSHNEVFVPSNTLKVQGPPSVKYRGIFINDEAPALTGWIDQYYPRTEYGPGFIHTFYSHVFELLLRLRANYLWPAMWQSMFNVDDPVNQPLADEYGIVMGTSHTEPMMRATNEWTIFGNGPWQWNTNNASIYPFFVYGAERGKPYEGIWTIGMRGVGDTALSATIETTELENVVAAQEQIFANLSMTDVPQMWCLYKEVQGYYEAGMRVPDNVTLLWTDDNFGNIRRMPEANETSRAGGAGVYYHFDYVGDPRNYKWINTVNFMKTYQQMTQAWNLDAQRIWILNVGDLKPLEIPINHFLDLAYNISAGDPSPLGWMTLWANQNFGADMGPQIASVMQTYQELAGLRKYELVGPYTYSLLNYEEANRVQAAWQNLSQQAQNLYDQLPSAAQPAFFEMILHPTLAGSNYYALMIASAKNTLYAEQGRTSANQWAQTVLGLFYVDYNLSVAYNTLLDSRWAHMMDQTHIGYDYWQQPMRQSTPPLQFVQGLEDGLAGPMGIMVEGSNATVPGDDMYHTLSSNTLQLPTYSPYGRNHWIEIFSKGLEAFTWDWNISADPFIQLNAASGTISPNSTDVRVYVSIDWSSCPSGNGNATMNVTSTGGYGTQYWTPTLIVAYNNTQIPSNFSNGFVEGDGYVSIDAVNYTGISHAATSGGTSVSFLTIPNYGVTLSPWNATGLSPSQTPYLQYSIYTFTTLGNANLTLSFAPSLNTNPVNPLTYAISVDSNAPQVVSFVEDQCCGNLPVNWTDAVIKDRWETTTQWNITEGAHTVNVWLLENNMVLKKVVLNLGGVVWSALGPPQSYQVVNGTSIGFD